MLEAVCKNCSYYDREKLICKHPQRSDASCMFYYGHIKESDSCALFERKELADEQ